MTERPPDLLEVGCIRRAHGVRGDVYVQLITDRTERVAPGARLFSKGRWLTVARSRPHQDRWIVTFADLDDREAAQAFTNAPVFAEPIPDAEGMWVHDLVGSSVVDTTGTTRGRCVALVENPAADLLELDSGVLVPVVFVTQQLHGVVTIDPPDGLFELFESDDGGD